MIIHKKCSTEISTFIEISTHFVPDQIIEYQIFCLILPIVHPNLGQKTSNFLIYKLQTIYTIQLSLSEVVSSSLEPSYHERIAFGMKLLSMSPSAFLSKACIKHLWINRSVQTSSHARFQSRTICSVHKGTG